MKFIDDGTATNFAEFLSYYSMLERYVGRVCREMGLSDTGLKILLYLGMHKDGAKRVSAGKYFGILSPNITRALKTLVFKGYVEDRNGNLLITQKGIDLLEELHDIIIAMQTEGRPYDDFFLLKDSKKTHID